MKTLTEQLTNIISIHPLQDVLGALKHACMNAENALLSHGRATEESLLYTAAVFELGRMQSELFVSRTRKHIELTGTST